MTTQQAIANIYNGKLVSCTKQEYHSINGIRLALQDAAAIWIDTEQDIRAVMALNEVGRLDNLYGSGLL